MCDQECRVRYRKNGIYVCSKDCGDRRIFLMKNKSLYIQCDLCDKLTHKTPNFIRKHNFCSKSCDYQYRRDVKQLGSGMKKISKKRKKYYGEFWGQITRKVRSEQDYKCNDCLIDEREYGKNLSVHHIKPFITFDSHEEANKRCNLVGVCEPCHRKRHSGDGHILKLDLNTLGKNSTSEYGIKTKKDRENAEEIVQLLFYSDLNLGEIANKTHTSRGTVTRIYHGKRWKELYEGLAPIHINPRAKSSVVNKDIK